MCKTHTRSHSKERFMHHECSFARTINPVAASKTCTQRAKQKTREKIDTNQWVWRENNRQPPQETSLWKMLDNDTKHARREFSFHVVHSQCVRDDWLFSPPLKHRCWPSESPQNLASIWRWKIFLFLARTTSKNAIKRIGCARDQFCINFSVIVPQLGSRYGISLLWTPSSEKLRMLRARWPPAEESCRKWNRN